MKNQTWMAIIFVNLLALVTGSPFHHLEPRQSSDGCGPNPLMAVMSYAREFADFSPQQLLRFIETDTRAGSQLRTLLRRYDDCVRTGDGARYKKSGISSNEMLHDVDTTSDEAGVSSRLASSRDKPTLSEVNQSLLRALGRSSS